MATDINAGNTVILLTACISPGAAAFTKLLSFDVRRQQYYLAIRHYLKNSKLRIVVVENTNTPLEGMLLSSDEESRLEYITYQGNNHDPIRGKGYGEIDIIKNAFLKSRVIAESENIIKITGRLIVGNLDEMILHANAFASSASTTVGTLQFNLRFAHSQFFIAPKSFYLNYLFPKAENIHDGDGYYFEHALASAIHDWVRNGGKHFNPYIPVNLIGQSASTGTLYSKPSMTRRCGVALRSLYVNICFGKILSREND